MRAAVCDEDPPRVRVRRIDNAFLGGRPDSPTLIERNSTEFNRSMIATQAQNGETAHEDIWQAMNGEPMHPRMGHCHGEHAIRDAGCGSYRNVRPVIHTMQV